MADLRHDGVMIPVEWPVPLALLIAGLAVSVIVALRYLLASGLFALATHQLRPGLYAGRGAQIAREIRWSLLSAAIYGVPAGIVLWGWRQHGWTKITLDWGALPVWYWPVSVFIYLFVQDSWFYWTHRAMHRPRLFRLAHAVHHQSRPPTAWAAMSFHPWEAISGAIVVPVLVFVVPIHLSALAMVLTIATVMGVTNHIGWEMFPHRLVHSPLGQWLITASHHERHHEDYQCNFGLYFRFWDRVCGTDRGLSRRMIQPAAHGAQAVPAE
jgi:Delta7-sterol 5-desaturase